MLFTDIETVPNEDLIRFLPEVAPPGNYKKPETIEKWWAENGETARQEQVAKMALDPCLFRLRAIAMADGVEAEPEVWLVRDEFEERVALAEFWVRAADSRPVVGYNLAAFDLPRIQWRSMALDIKPRRMLKAGKYSKDILDLMLVLKNFDTRTTSMAGMGQKQVCDLLGIPNPLPDIDGSMVAAMSDEEVITYAANDIEMLRAIYNKMVGIYFWELN